MVYECGLSAEKQKKAKKELNEKPEWRQRDIDTLKEMVLAHKGLKANTDDTFLLRFLRARKFDYERAYNVIINYYSVRCLYPEEMSNLTPNALEPVFSRGITMVLPHKDKEGRKLLYYRPGRWEHEKYRMTEMFRANLINFELMLDDEETQVDGMMFIIDLSGVGFNHLKGFDRTYAKLNASLLQDAFPVRVKGIHLFNEPAIMGAIQTVMKPFLKDKTASRMHFHGTNLKSLHKSVPAKLLPEELGGSLGPAEALAEEWHKFVKGKEEKFLEMQKYSIELPREIIKQKNDEKVEELAGTYKKLNVD